MIVTNIQRMCFHDGPGIRTTVFLKGCSVHCPWCSNPENLNFKIERISNNMEEVVFGREYSTYEILRELLKDEDYWSDGGGVTFSGGEALMHIPEIINLLQELKGRRIHLTVETSLFAPIEYVKKASLLFDLFYVDVKIMKKDLCMRVLGGDTDLYRANVSCLLRQGANIVFRIPCSDTYTFEKENYCQMMNFFYEISPQTIEIFELHELGKEKYRKMQKEIPKLLTVTPQNMLKLEEDLKTMGNQVSIIRI